jgi:uncharacterized protein YegP (UPF0339 family)
MFAAARFWISRWRRALWRATFGRVIWAGLGNIAIAGTVLSRNKGEKMAGKFVLKKGSTGKFHFNLVAGNGQVIATSEAYESKAAAMNGIRSVQTNAPTAEIEDETAG